MSRRIQQLFDSIAPRYDLLNSVLSLGIDRRWRREAVRLLGRFPELQSSRTTATRTPSYIDICAGTLALSREVLAQNPEAQITAVDFSSAMLRQGQARLASREAEHIHTQVGDALALPFPEKNFDAALCAYGIRNLDDVPLGLREIFRVLKPGGRVIILDFFRPKDRLHRFFQATYGRFLIPSLGGLLTGNRSAYEHLRDSIRGFYSLKDFCALLERVGFHEITSRSLTGGISGVVTGVKP